MPDDEAPAPEHLAAFVRSLDAVDSALDLGSGDGRLAVELRADDLTLADVSAVALARARRRVPAATHVELAPDAPLPFADSTFGLVLLAETIEHVRDVQLLLSEARRVLRPGGVLAVTTPAHGRATALAIATGGFERLFDPLSPHLRFLTRRSLRELLGALGFELRSLRRTRGTLLAVATR